MLLFVEGFDHEDLTTAASYLKWDSISSDSLTGSNSRFGVGNSVTFTQSYHYWNKNIGSNLQNGVLGVALRMTTDGGNAYRTMPFTLYDATSVQLGLVVNTNRTISIYRGSLSNILATSTYAIPSNTWVYLEFKFQIANSISASSTVVKVNGTAVITLAATTDTQATGNAYVDNYRMGGDGSVLAVATTTVLYDDHYFIDLTGSTNNDFLGEVRVLTLFPSGNGNTSNLVGSDSDSTNNYQLVDEVPQNGDSDYVESGTVTDKDTYAFDNTLSTTTTILGVAVNISAKKTDTNPRSISDVIRHSGTDYDGSNNALSTSYKNYQTIHEVNPGTSAAWTKSGVDAAEFGVKVTV